MKAVLFFCVLVFLNFAVMRSASCLCCGKNQERNALQNLLGEGREATNLIVSTDCHLFPAIEEFSTWLAIKENGNTYEYNPQKSSYEIQPRTIGIQVIPKESCRVGLDNFKPTDINVISNSESKKDKDFKECPSNGQNALQFQAFFLKFQENMNTFMFLDPNRARWFFTSELGGCDIFVAIDQSKPDNPLVIHSNMNVINNDKDNLEHKGDTVDKIMKFVPEGYKVKARVYHKSPDPGAQKYMETYKKNHDIGNIVFYDAASLESLFLFFGYYSNSVWHFFIKAQKGGETYKVL